MSEYRHSLVVGNGEPHFSLAYTSLARKPAFPYNVNAYCVHNRPEKTVPMKIR